MLGTLKNTLCTLPSPIYGSTISKMLYISCFSVWYRWFSKLYPGKVSLTHWNCASIASEGSLSGIQMAVSKDEPGRSSVSVSVESFVRIPTLAMRSCRLRGAAPLAFVKASKHRARRSTTTHVRYIVGTLRPVAYRRRGKSGFDWKYRKNGVITIRKNLRFSSFVSFYHYFVEMEANIIMNSCSISCHDERKTLRARDNKEMCLRIFRRSHVSINPVTELGACGL